MVPPSPELLRKFRNTNEVIISGRTFLIPALVEKYPNDYIDLITYESMKRIIYTENLI